MTTYNLVEGRTAPIPLRIKVAGAVFPLSGLGVQLMAYRRDKTTALAVAGTVTITNALTGELEYAPTSNDALLLAANSPVYIRWKLIDGLGKVDHFPTVNPDKWIVRKP